MRDSSIDVWHPYWYTMIYFFLKNGPHYVIGPDDEIKLPALSNMVDWEAEFAVVIGKPGKNISVENAFEHVAGLHDHE